MKRILLIEDEINVVSFIKKGLTEEGYEVTVALDGKTGMEFIDSHSFDLIIMDIMLPEIDGISLTRKLREAQNFTPILILSALSTSENIVSGLETGADDYLAKPFKFIELLARVRSLLRRSHLRTETPSPAKDAEYRFADIVLNDVTKKILRGDDLISLTSTEFKMLLHFLQHPHRVISRNEILEKVWGIDYDIGTNVVDVYINYLRKKTERTGKPRLIHTVVGMGYVLKESEDEESN